MHINISIINIYVLEGRTSQWVASLTVQLPLLSPSLAFVVYCTKDGEEPENQPTVD